MSVYSTMRPLGDLESDLRRESDLRWIFGGPQARRALAGYAVIAVIALAAWWAARMGRGW